MTTNHWQLSADASLTALRMARSAQKDYRMLARQYPERATKFLADAERCRRRIIDHCMMIRAYRQEADLV